MADSSRGEVTLLLRQLAEGNKEARDRLTELVYQELRAMAARQLHGVRGVTLQPTALVHEAWLKLAEQVDFADRRHFLGVAGRAMRRTIRDAYVFNDHPEPAAKW
jgi:RNA polymerase sigma factor (TIGR02999 family)